MTRQDIEEINFTRAYIEFLGDDISKLAKSIADLQAHIRTLEEKTEPQSPCTEDKPRSTSPVNKLEILVPAIADEKALLKERIELLQARKMIFEGTKNAYEKKINEIETFIASIDDQMIKLIIKLHCVEQLSWPETADKIGGNCTEGSIKMMFYRFFEKGKKDVMAKK